VAINALRAGALHFGEIWLHGSIKDKRLLREEQNRDLNFPPKDFIYAESFRVETGFFNSHWDGEHCLEIWL
jgi:hypothetical protein